MPKNEPELEDPLSLDAVGFDDPTGQSVRVMAECFASEFLRLGHTPEQVMDLFRSTEHQLARYAWAELGEVAIYTLVHSLAAEREEIRAAWRTARGGRHA